MALWGSLGYPLRELMSPSERILMESLRLDRNWGLVTEKYTKKNEKNKKKFKSINVRLFKVKYKLFVSGGSLKHQ